MRTYLDFEKPIAELEGKVIELKQLGAAGGAVDIEDEIEKLEGKASQLIRDTYGKLTPWQKAQVARHPNRPHFVDYVRGLIEDFVPLSGDRVFGEDTAILGGIGRFRGAPIVVLGHEKGSDTHTRVKHHFGSAKPEGYRKAVRLMSMAERFDIPVLSLVDTAGAYPGIASEERGVAEAIARSTDRCLSLGVPMVTVVIGEGGSGGAIGIAAANTVLMLGHSIYTVISPEGCASILWKDSKRAQDAAAAMRNHRPGSAVAQGDRRHHPRADRRRAPRSVACGQVGGRCDKFVAPGAEHAFAGRASPPAPREIPRHRPHRHQLTAGVFSARYHR